mmetsp:Transcript_927/g.1606  ORF Transcript_927/g.1606 Transcript_927/m.1606 type:complete len:313 (-) Transcript_927:149-1087(-)
MSNESGINVAVSVGIVPVPLHRLAQSLLPAHLLRPSQLMKLSGMDGVAQIVELTIGHEGDQLTLLVLLSEDLEQILGHLQVRYLIIAANVVNVGHLSLVEDGLERAGHILHEQKVPSVGPIAVQRELHVLEKLVGKLRDELLGILVRTVHVVAASNDAGQLERSVVGLDNELGTGLGSGVGVRRLEDMLLSHGLGIEVLALAVNLVGGHMDEATDGVTIFGRLQQHVRAVNVGLGEGEGVTERVVDVRLGGKVHHGIDLLLLEDVVDEIGTLDVTLDELEIGQILDVGQILEARAVIELVVDDNIVLRILSA